MKYELCETHDGEPRDRFCSDHSEIICGVCVSRKHESCYVKPVSEMFKTLNISTEEQLFNQSAESLLKYAKKVKQSVEDNNNMLDQEKNKIVDEAKEHRDKIMQQANRSFQDFVMELTQLYKEQKDILARENAGTDHIISDIEFILQSKSRSQGIRQFLDLCASADRLQLCAYKIKSIDVNILRMQSRFNMNIQPLSELQCKLGEISLERSTLQLGAYFPELYNPNKRQTQDGNQAARQRGAVGGNAPMQVKLTKKDKINVQLKDETSDCDIYGIDTTENGTVLLADNDNCKLKVVSPEGRLLSSLTLPERPKNIAVINKSEAAVSLSNKQIGIIHIADSGRLSLKRIITTQQYVWGIKVYNNNLIVTCNTSLGCPRSVQMIDMRGTILWTTTTDSEGNKLFDRALFLTP
ncbi:MAG: B-box zinc finger protein, partial [Candidatus Thiodiazotropha sp.]